MSGLFIVFEGVDGSGTTTQTRLLVQASSAKGLDVIPTREPGGTPIAEKIRQLVLDPENKGMVHRAELFLYAASRAQHVEERIKPALAAGKIVVSDRFAASTLAYQAYGRGLDREMVQEVNQYAAGGCQPDLTIFLDLSPDEALDRRRQRRDAPDRLEGAGADLQRKVAAAYREIACKDPHRSLVLDARPPPGKIAQLVLRALEERWPQLYGPGGEL